MLQTRAQTLLIAGLVLLLAGARQLPAQPWAGPAGVAIEVSAKGKAVAGARVLVRFREAPEGSFAVLTDSKGRAAVVNLAPGAWSLDVTHEAYLSYVAALILEPGKKATETTSFLQATGAGRQSIRVKYLKASGPLGTPTEAPPPPVRRAAAIPAPSPPPAPEPEPEPVELRQPDIPIPTLERETPPEVPREPAQTPDVEAPTVELREPDIPEPVAAPPAVPAPAVEPVKQPEPSLQTPDSPEPSIETPEPEEMPKPEPAPPVQEASAPLPEPMPEPVLEVTEPEPMPEAETPSVSEPQPAPSSPPPAATRPPVQATPPPPAELPEVAPVVESPPTVEPPMEQLEPPVQVPETPEVVSPEPAPTPPAPATPEAPAATEPTPEPPTILEPPVSAESPEPEAEPAPEPTPQPVPRVPSPSLRAFRDRTCPECKPGEWSAASVELAASGSGCPADALERAAESARLIARSPSGMLEGFAGPAIGGVSPTALELVPGETRSALARSLGWANKSCKVMAVALPRQARFNGFRYEAADDRGQADCVGEVECPIGDSRFLGNPGISRGSDVTVFYTVFENRSGEASRRARFTVYFNPAQGWTP